MMRVEWEPYKVKIKIGDIIEDWGKEYAEKIQRDAIAILNSKTIPGKAPAKKKGKQPHLATEIDVFHSRYKNGGYYVQAQGPRNWSKPYHASFVELGLKKTRDMDPIPFMRPALKKHYIDGLMDLKQHLI